MVAAGSVAAGVGVVGECRSVALALAAEGDSTQNGDSKRVDILLGKAETA